MSWHTFWLIPRPFTCIEHISVVLFGIYKIRHINYARGLRLVVIFSTDQFEGILPRGPCLPCLRMADYALFWQDTLELCHYFRVIPLHWDNLKISLSASASAQYHAGLVYSFRKNKAPLRYRLSKSIPIRVMYDIRIWGPLMILQPSHLAIRVRIEFVINMNSKFHIIYKKWIKHIWGHWKLN